MTAPSRSIDELRRDIDVIDDEIHDLLMQRIEIVELIGALKNDAPGDLFIRPAREAQILRRLVRRHRGRFPAPVVVRIWREMLAATSRLQGPLSVAVHAPKKSVGYWDMVRDHYGSATRISLHRLASSVLRAVVDGTVTVGVLPMPSDDDTDPWWPKLTGDDEHMPRVIARVPFIENKNGRFERLGALAIARTLPGESGDDISLVAVEASTGISRASLKDAFEAAGMSATDIAVWRGGKAAKTRLHLIEVADYVGPDDSRVAAVATGLGERILRTIGLGGYAVPIAGSNRPGG